MTQEAAQPDDIEAQVRRVTAAVLTRTRSSLPEDVVEATVRDGFTAFRDARVKDFVGVLVERKTVDRVRGHAVSDA